MIVLTIVRSSSKMGTVAPVVSEIFEKTIAYVNRMFLQKQIFFLKLIKIETKIINKLRVAMETVSRAYFACIVKFFISDRPTASGYRPERAKPGIGHFRAGRLGSHYATKHAQFKITVKLSLILVRNLYNLNVYI